MHGDGDLVRQAATGNVAAHLSLVDVAIAAGAAGTCRQIESLAAAETWARLAAAVGDVGGHRALAKVLRARSEYEVGRSSVYNAQWYDAEARRVLKVLVALDDEDAKRTLDEMGAPLEGDEHETDVLAFTTLAAAAKGDLNALTSLYDEAFRILHTGQSDPIEALTAGELYARLGSASGDADQMQRLAGALLKRAEYEYDQGWPALADNAVAEAAVLLAILIENGEPSMASRMVLLMEFAPMTAIAVAARYRPDVLKYVETQGTC